MQTRDLRLLNSDEEDITSLYCNKIMSYYERNVWQQWITELPPGIYTVTNTSGNTVYPTTHGEWYGEAVNNSYYLLNNNNYYIINSSNYNTSTKKYVPVSSVSEKELITLECDDLTSAVTYDGETLRPIDKFDGEIQLIFNNQDKHAIYGRKSYKEMCVDNCDFNNGAAEQINSIVLESNLIGNDQIKLAISPDKGISWFTNNGTGWENLNIVIPTTSYNNLTKEEKNDWNHAIDVIEQKGFSPSKLNEFDYSSFENGLPEFIRFAYVLISPDYENTSEIHKLTWNFNEKGNMEKMKDSEYTINVFGRSIKMTSLIDADLMKINVMI